LPQTVSLLDSRQRLLTSIFMEVLRRFTDAQDLVYAQVCAELRAGRKRTHWMWFIFPQLRGLGHSGMAQRFAIGSLAEAEAYLAHPVLGSRLKESTELANGIQNRTAEEIFGNPDHLKFRSSLTLFAAASPAGSVFDTALKKYFDGHPDQRTLDLLG
jgi:uncharacterized protein (DUF1810 family)